MLSSVSKGRTSSYCGFSGEISQQVINPKRKSKRLRQEKSPSTISLKDNSPTLSVSLRLRFSFDLTFPRLSSPEDSAAFSSSEKEPVAHFCSVAIVFFNLLLISLVF